MSCEYVLFAIGPMTLSRSSLAELNCIIQRATYALYAIHVDTWSILRAYGIVTLASDGLLPPTACEWGASQIYRAHPDIFFWCGAFADDQEIERSRDIPWVEVTWYQLWHEDTGMISLPCGLYVTSRDIKFQCIMQSIVPQPPPLLLLVKSYILIRRYSNSKDHRNLSQSQTWQHR